MAYAGRPFRASAAGFPPVLFIPVTALLLLVYHGWSAGRAANLRGGPLLAATSVAVALGVVMVVLKDVVLLHLH